MGEKPKAVRGSLGRRGAAKGSRAGSKEAALDTKRKRPKRQESSMGENAALTYTAFRQAREITSREHVELRAFLRAKVVKSEAQAKGDKPVRSGRDRDEKKQK